MLLEVVLSDIAASLLDRPVALGRFSECAFRDASRIRTLTAPGVTVTESGSRTWEPGRDGGWGHTMHWLVEAGPATAEFTSTAWEPEPKGLALRLEGTDTGAFRRLRSRLRERLGGDADQTDSPWPALDNVEWALDQGDRQLAQELLRAALAHPEAGPTGPWHARLAALRARVYAGGSDSSST